MRDEQKPRTIVIGRREFIEGSEEYKNFLIQTGQNKKVESKVESNEPEKNSRNGNGKDAGKP